MYYLCPIDINISHSVEPNILKKQIEIYSFNRWTECLNGVQAISL